MIFYSFYTDKYKSPDSLVYRTNDGWSQLQVDLKLFTTKEGEGGAQSDFFQLLWDHPDFRQGEYFDTSGKKLKKDAKQETQNTAYTKLPDGFQLELDKCYNVDCMMFMKEVPNKYIDYVFTSPPYNAGQRTSFGERNAIYKDNESMYGVHDDTLEDKDYQAWMFSVIDELLRITKKHIFWNVQMLGNNKYNVIDTFTKYKYNIKDLIIWNKTIASPHIVKGIMNSAFEFIIIFSNWEPEKRVFKDGNFGGNFRNVITGLNASQNEHKELNKATFPLYLPRTIIQKFGKKGDVWYDPFGGTGTTAHAAELEERHWLMTEIDPLQVEVSRERVEAEMKKIKIDFPDPNEQRNE